MGHPGPSCGPRTCKNTEVAAARDTGASRPTRPALLSGSVCLTFLNTQVHRPPLPLSSLCCPGGVTALVTEPEGGASPRSCCHSPEHCPLQEDTAPLPGAHTQCPGDKGRDGPPGQQMQTALMEVTVRLVTELGFWCQLGSRTSEEDCPLGMRVAFCWGTTRWDSERPPLMFMTCGGRAAGLLCHRP